MAARRRSKEAGEDTAADAWVRGLAHEVGNRLAAIRLSAHLLRNGDPSETEATVRDIECLAAEAGTLLGQLRPLLGTEAEEPARLEIRDVFGALERALADWRKGVVRVEIESADPGLPAVFAPSELLCCVLENLVLGALEASRPRGCVRLAAERTARRVVFVIEDAAKALDRAELALDPPRGGRELAVRIADRALQPFGGRVKSLRVDDANRVEVVLPARS